jgi:hypothetical protein
MKKLSAFSKISALSALAALALSFAAPGAIAQPHVGVSVGIHQPGVYGRINIGDVPPPALVMPQPVLIAPAPHVERRPIYLYVPPAHQHDWRRHCGHYNACNQPVYFVREQWVRERYEHEHPGWHQGHRGHGPGPAHPRQRRGYEQHDHHDRGHGHGHDRGHRRD